MAKGTPEQCVAGRVRNQFDLGCDGVIMHGATPDELEPVVEAYAAARRFEAPCTCAFSRFEEASAVDRERVDHQDVDQDDDRRPERVVGQEPELDDRVADGGDEADDPAELVAGEDEPIRRRISGK